MIDINKVKIDNINYGAYKIYEYGVELIDEDEFMLDSQVANIFNNKFDILKINLYLDNIWVSSLSFVKVSVSEQELIYATGFGDEDKVLKLTINKDASGHFNYSIDETSGGGGGSGGITVPTFDAHFEGEPEFEDFRLTQEDLNDIWKNKYPLINVRVTIEEEGQAIYYVICFKLSHNVTGMAMSYAMTSMEFSSDEGHQNDLDCMAFVVALDEETSLPTIAAINEEYYTNDYRKLENKPYIPEIDTTIGPESLDDRVPSSKCVYDAIAESGGNIEYATNNDIDALFEESEDVLVESIEFTNLPEDHFIELNVGDVVDMSQYIEVSPADATDKSYTLTTDAPSVLSINGTTITVLQGAEGLNANLTVTANDGSGCSDIMIVDILNGEEPDPEEDVRIESIRYTDGQGQTCIGFNMLEGETVDLWTNLEILPADYTDGVEFISDDDGIVQVDSGGIATATGSVGESTTITISSMEDPTINTTVEISINEDEPEE